KKKEKLVGIIRGNRKELTKLTRETKDNMTHFIKLYRSDNYILTIYKMKPNKKVLEFI
ncbi:unnamed protein product, partial [Heterotrigona itama]